MIKTLKRRLIITLTTILTLIFWIVLFAINLENYTFSMTQSSHIFHNVMDQNGPAVFIENSDIQPMSMLTDSKVSILQFDTNNNFVSCLYNNINTYDENTLVQYATKILNKHKPHGFIHGMSYQKEETPNGTFITFMYSAQAAERLRNLTNYSILLGILGSFIIFIVSTLLSNWLVKPAAKAFEQQKQFISDASHELKTPLTVITANADILEREMGDYKWLQYIQSEAKRMSTLINNLLALAKLDDSPNHSIFTSFDLSSAVTGISLPFESVAYENKITLNCNIDPNISIIGNETQIKQIVSILLDNAIKHTSLNGYVSITLSKYRKRIILSVSNTGDAIPKEEQDKIFQRFYRLDEARNRDAKRYGLGLSIAKSIIDSHNGSIQVHCENGTTTFSVSLPTSHNKVH